MPLQGEISVEPLSEKNVGVSRVAELKTHAEGYKIRVNQRKTMGLRQLEERTSTMFFKVSRIYKVL